MSSFSPISLRQILCSASLFAAAVLSTEDSILLASIAQTSTAEELKGPDFRAVIDANNVTMPESIFFSRPDLMAPILHVSVNNATYVSPGYIFVCPYWTDQTAPYIYDGNGDLIWSGYGSGGAGTSVNMNVVTIDNTPHLSVNNVNINSGFGRGHGLILDSSYRVVNSVHSGNGRTASDLHEFNVIGDGSTAILTIYNQVQADLTNFGITEGMGWIIQGLFQEINIATGEILFEWNCLDHVDPSLSYTAMNSTDVAGTGLTYTKAWDYFHINAIDKTSGGDYLVSSRATSCIYKVSGQNGSIIWKLNGKNSDFALQGFNFAFQHDVRFRSEDATTTVLSLFNNGWDGYNKSSPTSSGMLISVDNSTMKATLVHQYYGRGSGIGSASQGSMQVLPNNNVFMGWGSIATVTEHSQDGNTVFEASLGSQGISNYRAFRYSWTSNPIDLPAIWTYAKSNTSNTATYVSWNGATEVRSWIFYTSASLTGNYTAGTAIPKNGFETMVIGTSFAAYSYAEALDGSGKSLAKSLPVKTFVPGAALAPNCGDVNCKIATKYTSAPPE